MRVKWHPLAVILRVGSRHDLFRIIYCGCVCALALVFFFSLFFVCVCVCLVCVYVYIRICVIAPLSLRIHACLCLCVRVITNICNICKIWLMMTQNPILLLHMTSSLPLLLSPHIYLHQNVHYHNLWVLFPTRTVASVDHSYFHPYFTHWFAWHDFCPIFAQPSDLLLHCRNDCHHRHVIITCVLLASSY